MAVMSGWEYKLVESPRSSTHEEVKDMLDKLGNEGWELCGVDYGAFILKRCYVLPKAHPVNI